MNQGQEEIITHIQTGRQTGQQTQLFHDHVTG